MGRYIGSPESLVSEIENIVPLTSRFTNRCLYSTPGTYSFTVPAGKCSITAVAVGPGGAQCSIMKCLVTCGRLCCLQAIIGTQKCLVTAASCSFSCPACNPTANTCLCAFDVCRCLCVRMVKQKYCFFQCTNGVTNPSNSICMCHLGLLNQTQFFTHTPSGPGGGYTEKTANTLPGCVYSVVVGQNCCAGGFSCVSGANVSICATGPKLSSNAHFTEPTQCDVYFHNGTAYVCMLPENIVTNCQLCTTTCATPARCWACQCRWGAFLGMCYCIVNSWDFKCSPGCGFGGDINRVGGFCALDLCNSLTGTSNTSHYQYDCYMCSMQLGCLTGTLFGCSGGAGGCVTTAEQCMSLAPAATACCTTISSIQSYNFIRSYLREMCGSPGMCFQDCCCTSQYVGIITCELFKYEQSIREVGNTISCVTNFNVVAPGTNNPYSTPAAVTQHSCGKWSTVLCMCSNSQADSGFCCCPSAAGCCNDCMRYDVYYDFMCACLCFNPFRTMNCANVGNVNNRFKFGGSSAGNYFRNGVSGLGDESTYALTCNRQFGHCGSTPYVFCCAFNSGYNNFSSTGLVTHCGCRSTTAGQGSGGVGWFNDTYCMLCVGATASGGYGPTNFCCMLCNTGLFGLWAVQKTTGNQYGFAGSEFFCTSYICDTSGACLSNSLDILDVRLPNALTTCQSGFTGFQWKAYNNPYKYIWGNQMFNSYGALNGIYDSTALSSSGCCRLGHFFCENVFLGGDCTYRRTCVWPARTTNRYYSTCWSLDSNQCSSPAGILRCIIPISGTYTSLCEAVCVCMLDCSYAQCRQTSSTLGCYMVACHNYWPCCVGYNFATTTCRVFNMNPTINLYDYWCSSPCLCAVNQVGLQTPFCHMLTFGYHLVYPEKWLTSMYYPGANTLSPCCIYKSTDNIDITDNHYNVTYTAGLTLCGCSLIAYCNCTGTGQQTSVFNNRAIITRLNTNVCLGQTKTLSTISCPLASNQTYAQGGAGIGTAGIWGEGAITCTLLCSGGGNIKCIVPCCNIQMCFSDAAIACSGTCTFCKALGWGLGPTHVSLSLVDLTCCGSGALISPQFIGLTCCCGMSTVVGGCTGNLPINSMCTGCSSISHVDLLNSGGLNYSTCTVICSNIDRCVFTSCFHRSFACALFCCFAAFCCACWIPDGTSYRCATFTTTDGCVRGMSGCQSVIIQPLFCAIVQPTFATYSCIASTFSEGSGGGSKTGQSYCAKYASVIDSPTIVSISPARGGRGNESPYEPYYYSYPGISARLSTPKSPAQYVGDAATGCCWFDTPQINGSGGNGMFCSANFSCIFVQEAGPGGGGSNGAKADGTICGIGGTLGGGAGCCGAGGNGGGAGWMGTPGTGMVVIYWN